MRNKKGFTLVELLAVIVILVIIALIATPIILNVINDAKKQAAKDSVYGYIDAIEKAIVMDQFDNKSKLPVPDSDGCYIVKELDKIVNVKGTKPKIEDNAKVCLKEGTITNLTGIEVDGFSFTYDGKELTQTKGDIKPIYYYAFGTPTTSSTTDYTTLDEKVFTRLGSDGSTVACARDEKLFCIKPNDVENTKILLKEHFGESSCNDIGSEYYCGSGNFVCSVSESSVYCYDSVSSKICNAYADGSFSCS